MADEEKQEFKGPYGAKINFGNSFNFICLFIFRKRIWNFFLNFP